MIEFILECILDLIQEVCFCWIRRHVKSKFLRGVLYILVVAVITAIALGIVLGAVLLGFQLVIWLLDLFGSLLS